MVGRVQVVLALIKASLESVAQFVAVAVDEVQAAQRFGKHEVQHFFAQLRLACFGAEVVC